MRLTELIYEMATLHPQWTGVGLPIYVGPEEVYGTRLPHDTTRIKIKTKFGDIPLTIPQSKNEIADIPDSIKQKKIYLRKIPKEVLNNIQTYVSTHRIALTDFYYQRITEPQLKERIGYKK